MITSLDEMLHISFYTYNVLLPRNYCIKFVLQFNLRTCTNHIQKIQKTKYLVRNTTNIINNYYHILINILKSHVTSVSFYLKSVILFFAAFPISLRNKDRLVRNQDNVLERRCMPTIKLRTVFVSVSEHGSPSGEQCADRSWNGMGVWLTIELLLQ